MWREEELRRAVVVVVVFDASVLCTGSESRRRIWRRAALSGANAVAGPIEVAMEHIATATIILQDRIRDRAGGDCGGACICEVVGGGANVRVSVSVGSRCDIMCDGLPILKCCQD